MSFFEHIEELPSDSIFGLLASYDKDERIHKINLSIGIYRGEDLKTTLMEVVKKAQRLISEEGHAKDYLPSDGHAQFLEATIDLLFKHKHEHLFGLQTVGATGALRLGAEFIALHLSKEAAISNPSWPNHRNIFLRVGMNVGMYPYIHPETKELDFPSLLKYLETLPAKTTVVLHACCHNPSGFDLTHAMWKQLASLIKRKQLFPFFDLAYLGFGESVEEDSFSLRLFTEENIEFFAAISYAKNFTLYAERAGALVCFLTDPQKKASLMSHFRSLVRTNYSNPPLHGAQIVYKILSTPSLKEEWKKQLKVMKERTDEMRKEFLHSLSKKMLHRDFKAFYATKGLFMLTGLTKEQVERLKEQFGIYLTGDSRINFAGLNKPSIDYVTTAIAKVWS